MNAALLGLAAAGAVLFTGSEKPQATNSNGARIAASAETKTVEFVESSQSDFHQRMVQWNREGWLVLSFSARLPQPDGTVLRRVKLSRASPDSLLRTNATAGGFTVQRSFPSDPRLLREAVGRQMQNFADEGWLVLSGSAPMPQTDGTVRITYLVKRKK
jgi:hypothetical protein